MDEEFDETNAKTLINWIWTEYRWGTEQWFVISCTLCREFTPTRSCVSLPRPTTSSVYKLLRVCPNLSSSAMISRYNATSLSPNLTKHQVYIGGGDREGDYLDDYGEYYDDYVYDYGNATTVNYLPVAELVIAGLVYGMTLVLGVLGNVLVILSIARNRRMQTVTNSFLASLASADLLLILLCVPVKVRRLQKKHLYNICTMLDQRWEDVVEMLYKCFWFAGTKICKASSNYSLEKLAVTAFWLCTILCLIKSVAILED